jgi:hypothetical protein
MSSAPTSPTTATRCAACGQSGTGRFCSACGAPLGGTTCAGCASPLASGAKFCHRCGLAAAEAPLGGARGVGARAAAAGAMPGTLDGATPAGRSSALPWGIAFASIAALAIFAASSNLGKPKGSGLDAPLNALPQASLGEAPPGGAPFAGGAAGGPGGRGAVDISRMTPREMADRLFDRIMRLSSEGKADSVGFFAQMALQNYESMPDKDLDLRYDMGRVAEVAGQAEVAQAQADTMLTQNPKHLLGLVLAARAAALRGDAKAVAGYERRLVEAAPTERGRNLEEYQRHGNDIEAALRTATPAAAGPARPATPAPATSPR